MSHYTTYTTCDDDVDTDDDNDDVGLSAMMAQAVVGATSRSSRGRKQGEGRDDSRSRSRSLSVNRRKKNDKKKKDEKKDCAPSTPRRQSGRSRDASRSRSRSRSILRRMAELGQKNGSTAATSSVTSTAAEFHNKISDNNKTKPERTKSSSKKKQKKVKRNKSSTGIDDDDETSSRRSNSSKVRRNNSSNKKKKSKLPKTTASSRVEAIREPILTTEGAVIKDEMNNFFPSPKSSPKPLLERTTVTTTTTAAATTTNQPNSTDSIANGNSINGKIAVISFESDDLTTTPQHDDYDRTTQQDSSSKSGSSIHKYSQKSVCSGSGSSNFGIISNKAAQESAEAALNRVAAQTEKNSNSSFGGGIDAAELTATSARRTEGRRRRSSSNIIRNEQYQRLHRDSGLTSIDDNDDDDSYKSRKSKRNNDISALHKQLDERTIKAEELQNQLAEVLAKVEQLNNDLRSEEDRSRTAGADLSCIRSQLDDVQEEKSFLIESVRDMEDDFVAKDERIKNLQQVVETQLNMMEFLEDKLDKTEEELVLMEDELNELLLLVENRTVTDSGVIKHVSNESIHDANKQVLLARMGSIREDMVKRKDSIKMQKEQSRRLLLNECPTKDPSRLSHLVTSSTTNSDDLDKREDILKIRESKLVADREKYSLQEERLHKWEQELLELDGLLKERECKARKENERATVEGLKEKKDIKEPKNHCEATKTSGSLELGENQELFDLDREREHESMKTLITSLEKEKESLYNEQINERNKLKKLKLENEDLRVQLCHIRATTTNNNGENNCPRTLTPSQSEIDMDDEATIHSSEEKCVSSPSTREYELSNALALVNKKNLEITNLEKKLEELNEISQNAEANDEEGKDLLIRELQNQLVTAKKETYQLSSGSYVTKLKLEIKRLKKEESISKSHLKKKDDYLKLSEKQMHKLKIELERREKRDKNLGTDQILSDGDLQNHIEDLEEEIFHWKSANVHLENEIEILKSKTPKGGHDDNDEDIVEDDRSIGSIQSLNSQFEMSMNNVSQDDMFFVSNSNSVSSINGVLPLQEEEPATPSKRAMQTVTSLWTKMRSGAEPANSNLAFPYATGSLNDE